MDSLGFTMATEAVVSVGTNTEDGKEVSNLRKRLNQLEKERAKLQEMLSSRDDELRQLGTEREELEKKTERWKAEQTKQWEKERQHQKQELEQLLVRILILEEDKIKTAQAEHSSLSATMAKDQEDVRGRSGLKEGEECDTGGGKKDGQRDVEKKRSKNRPPKEKEEAARVIQKNWREYRNRDIVMVQSALRGHLLRESQLKDLPKDTQNKAEEAPNHSDVVSSVGDMDVGDLTMIQSALRGHLARSSLTMESPVFSVPSSMGQSLPKQVPGGAHSTDTPSRTGAASLHNDEKRWGGEGNPQPVSGTHALTPTADQSELHCTAESRGAAAGDSDDSDDIIVSPSRPLRSREGLIS
uniref:IQ domain-containing protein E n=1 Tax=Monopterus albus TaxID=43700 RepID=UPI0009B4B111|nr:IQ domain-containing protein E [Monopterus albus]